MWAAQSWVSSQEKRPLLSVLLTLPRPQFLWISSSCLCPGFQRNVGWGTSQEVGSNGDQCLQSWAPICMGGEGGAVLGCAEVQVPATLKYLKCNVHPFAYTCLITIFSKLTLWIHFLGEKKNYCYFHINIYLKTVVSSGELNLKTRPRADPTFNC